MGIFSDQIFKKQQLKIRKKMQKSPKDKPEKCWDRATG